MTRAYIVDRLISLTCVLQHSRHESTVKSLLNICRLFSPCLPLAVEGRIDTAQGGKRRPFAPAGWAVLRGQRVSHRTGGENGK